MRREQAEAMAVGLLLVLIPPAVVITIVIAAMKVT